MSYAECIMLRFIMLIVIMLRVIILTVIMLNVIILSVVMLSVVKISVMAPFQLNWTEMHLGKTENENFDKNLKLSLQKLFNEESFMC